VTEREPDLMTTLDLGDTRDPGPFLSAPGRTRRWMNWMFADKGRMFWTLQIFGWVGFFFLHVLSVSTFVAGRSLDSLVYSFASSLIGFLTTSIFLRPIFRFARRQDPMLLLLIVLTTTIFMAVAMSAMKVQTFSLIFGDAWRVTRGEAIGTTNFLVLILPDLPPNLFLLGSWGGFYFGVNYYLNLRNETERAILSARLADQAQLKMLRYQLNPHFLFNTLNAISTLVLEQNGKQANSMITQLSAFLRYSLDSDPLQKTTLAEEMRALQLYLNIEETRFAERLSVKLEIDDNVLDALVPSLILQPAIENAIKYAIAKMENGGEIKISARQEGAMLLMQVCDNGPQAPDDPQELLRRADAGVGLLNMRDRLVHLYADRCVFNLSRIEPAGLCVCLKIPFETRDT